MVYSTMYTWEIRKVATSAFFETPKRVVTQRRGQRGGVLIIPWQSEQVEEGIAL